MVGGAEESRRRLGSRAEEKSGRSDKYQHASSGVMNNANFFAARSLDPPSTENIGRYAALFASLARSRSL